MRTRRGVQCGSHPRRLPGQPLSNAEMFCSVRLSSDRQLYGWMPILTAREAVAISLLIDKWLLVS